MESGNKRLSEGLIIAGIPLIGYVVAFAYELGYARYYAIPPEFISLTMTQVLIATTALLGLIIFFAQVLILVPSSQSPVSKAFWRTSPYLIMFVAALFIFGAAHWREWIFLLGVLIFFCFMELVFPMLVHREEPTYARRLAASEQADQTVAQSLAIKPVVDAVSKQAVLLFLCVAVVVYIAFLSGRGTAITQETYYVDSSKSNVVVLRFYGDTVVLHEYDSATKKLKGDLIVTKISEKQPLRLQEKKIGHLEKDTP